MAKDKDKKKDKKDEEKENKVTKDELEELRNQLARALADYDNLRKRVEKEKEEFRKVANLNLVSSLLPAIDMLENAQKHLKDSGLALTIKELQEALYTHGIEKINAKEGEKFNEEVHEAVEVISEGGREDGEIIEEVLTGWRFNEGPVIRASKVKVFRKDK